MLPFIVGGAILAVGFGALAFFFDVETEKEKERQNTLKKDIKDYTHKAQQAKKCHKHQQTLKIADHCLNIIQRYLQEIERLQQEKKETPTQLKAVLEQIQQEMKSLPIQQKHALQIYYNRFEDAQRRALAYLGYLSRLKIQLQEKEKRLKSDLGEIKKLEQKVKKNNENIASNQEWLERHREWRDESQSNNPDNADKMQERMDRNKDNIRKAKDFIAKTQNWIKKKECDIDEILKHIQTMEPNYLLPQDFLYVGKLACVNKSEIYAHDGDEESGWNIYGQRLSLESGEHEKKLWDSYNSQEEFYILITRQNKEDNRFFKASLCKGLLYKHILEESVFEVSPNTIDWKMTKCLFHGIQLSLPIEYKEFKHKKYTPRDTLKVWVTNYDSLLKSVFIAEKEPEPKHMDVIMLFNDRLGSQILKYAYIFNDFNFNYSVLDYQKNGAIKNTSQFYDPKNIIRWINVEGEHQLEKTSSYNKDQVQKIIELLEQINRALNQRKIRKTIGIITPYNAQKRRLRSEVEKCSFKNFDELKIDTVDAFQGEEADIIIYSTVKTCGNLSFLLDSKRLNVAISRAKENLIFVGKKSFFENLRSDEKNIFSAILQVCR
ncbi:regulator of nonsense transcripts 1 [Helicobacter pylori ELS37]|uniref:Regulator of nonsense transcripts 1 n=1 Tax=Helicobacter pylori ELS37 TaxID=1055527 RepID=A0ABC7ZFN2_HELPX|nr:AAA domain-containing protein [Helicobacter pylori]AFF20316.1 regulator of nonsense transcripts 1 [Helicobacter pylori ELS37]